MSYFTFRKVEMTDGSELYEIVTPDGMRVASATDDDAMSCLEIELNDLLREAAERNPDIVINCVDEPRAFQEPTAESLMAEFDRTIAALKR